MRFYLHHMSKKNSKKKIRPEQKQNKQPGAEHKMVPVPKGIDKEAKACGKMINKKVLISGGDSGIGAAAAIAFAREGADVAIIYLDEHKDAEKTKKQIEKEGRNCLLLLGDVSDQKFCKKAVKELIKNWKKIDVLVNNAAVQYPNDDFLKITSSQLEKTFRINIFSYFFLSQAALPYMEKGSSIINTTSVTAYRGSHHLIDYASTKGAIVAFTRSLAQALTDKKIRVNGVAPGPVWTPLIPSSFNKEEVAKFGSDVPMKRAAEPYEIAPSYVFLASDDSSFFTGQILHPNGGEIING
jgi:NAD(P)-dependent dehydrogenase (short-subunit alcohol dehydrogenase family)